MNRKIDPPEGFSIDRDRDAGEREPKYVLTEHGLEVSRHHTRGAALLAAQKRVIEKANGRKA